VAKDQAPNPKLQRNTNQQISKTQLPGVSCLEFGAFGSFLGFGAWRLELCPPFTKGSERNECADESAAVVL
jgi:hypothetical protein